MRPSLPLLADADPAAPKRKRIQVLEALLRLRQAAAIRVSLIARDAVEKRVLEVQRYKRRLADAILTACAAPLADLRREDLELLLS